MRAVTKRGVGGRLAHPLLSTLWHPGHFPAGVMISPLRVHAELPVYPCVSATHQVAREHTSCSLRLRGLALRYTVILYLMNA
jgi:hypothetical protein